MNRFVCVDVIYILWEW